MYATTASSRFDNRANAGRRSAFLGWMRRMFELSGQPYADGVLPPL
jgi:hypothetical protein